MRQLDALARLSVRSHRTHHTLTAMIIAFDRPRRRLKRNRPRHRQQKRGETRGGELQSTSHSNLFVQPRASQASAEETWGGVRWTLTFRTRRTIGCSEDMNLSYAAHDPSTCLLIRMQHSLNHHCRSVCNLRSNSALSLSLSLTWSLHGLTTTVLRLSLVTPRMPTAKLSLNCLIQHRCLHHGSRVLLVEREREPASLSQRTETFQLFSHEFSWFVPSHFPVPHIMQQGSCLRKHLRSYHFAVFTACQHYSVLIFGCCSPLDEVSPLDPACLAWTDESLLRHRSDDSSHNSRVWIGAASSKSDAMVENGLAPLLSASSAQANAGADSQDTSFSNHSASILQCFGLALRSMSVTARITLQCQLLSGSTKCVPCVFGCFSVSPGIMVSGIFTASRGLDATLAAGAQRCKDKYERVPEHDRGLYRAVAGSTLGLVGNAPSLKAKKALE